MKKKRQIFIVAFFLPLFLLSLFTFLLPAQEFSENENRTLAPRPQFSYQNISSGNYQSELTAYLSDQVPLREFWIQSNTSIKKLSGQKEINGMYTGDDHYYFQKFTDDSYSSTRMASIFQMIDNFVQTYSLPASVMLIPSPGTVLPDKLPDNAPYYNADPIYEAAEQNLSCTVIDLRDTFLANADTTQLYYRTDHHWTSQGAYLAYQAYCQSIGVAPKEYTLEKVADSFYGTLYSKLLDGSAVPDEIYAPVNIPEVVVTYEDGTTSNTLYHPDKLGEKDKYTYFLGGNYGEVTLKTNANTGKKLLLIKDSFSNSVVPFLLGAYDEIVVIDLRYYTGNIADVIQSQGITQMLFLYEVSNLLTDTGIARLIYQ